jgi:hypothetical protein
MFEISDASLTAAGLADKKVGPERSVIERLGLDAFIARFPRANTKSIEKFYDNYQDATVRKKSIEHAKKLGLEPEEKIEEAYQKLDKIYDYKALQRAYQAMQRSQKTINNILNDPNIESDVKKELIDSLYMQQIEFAKLVNEDVRRYRIAQKD